MGQLKQLQNKKATSLCEAWLHVLMPYWGFSNNFN
jgi:hypothetical protein